MQRQLAICKPCGTQVRYILTIASSASAFGTPWVRTVCQQVSAWLLWRVIFLSSSSDSTTPASEIILKLAYMPSQSMSVGGRLCRPSGQSPKEKSQTESSNRHGLPVGSEPDSGLSTLALIWMIARIQALASLAFDLNPVRVVGLQANVDGEVYDSTRGWPIDHIWPHLRKVLSPDAIEHGLIRSELDPLKEHINERVHWSAIKKRGRHGTIFGVKDVPYEPTNLPGSIPADKVANITTEEQTFLCQ